MPIPMAVKFEPSQFTSGWFLSQRHGILRMLQESWKNSISCMSDTRKAGGANPGNDVLDDIFESYSLKITNTVTTSQIICMHKRADLKCHCKSLKYKTQQYLLSLRIRRIVKSQYPQGKIATKRNSQFLPKVF